MAPSVSASTQWSSTSVIQINNYLPSVIKSSCLALCGGSTGGGGNTNLAPIPEFSYTPNDTACINRQVQFEDNSKNTPTTYKWAFQGGTPATSTLANPKVIFKTAGSYAVTLTVTNSFGSNSLVKKINVISTPTPLFSYKVNNFKVDFTNNTVEPATWLWKFGNGKTSTDKNPSQTYANNGSFNVQLTATNTCGTRTVSKLVPVFVNTPAATFKIDVPKGCAPFTVKTNNLSTNAQTYLWKLDGSTTPTSSDKNPNITYNKSGIYDITLIAYNGSLADTFVQKNIVIVNDKPLVAFKSVISDNGQVTFENKTQQADSIFWNFGDNNFSKDSLPSHFYTKSGQYIVTLKAKNECGSHSIQDTIDVLLPPIAKFVVDSSYTNCDSVKITLKNSSSDDASSFLWKIPTATLDSSYLKEPTITYTKSGTYNITLYAKNASGIDSFSQKISITIKEKPIAFFSDSTFLNTIWLKNQSKNGLKYDWNFGDSTSSQAFEPIHQYSKDGIYAITLRVINDCDTNVFTKLVRFVTLPSAAFSQNASGNCTPINVDFKQEASANAEQFYWYFEGGKPSVSNEPNPKILYNTPGVYSVSLVVKNLAGSDSIFKKELIEVKPQPKAVFIANVQGAKVVFKNISTDAASYLWNFGDGEQSTEESPTHLYKNAGTYNVRLSVKNDCGSDSSITTLMLNFVASNDVNDIGEISISPNPTTGYFTLSIKNLKANIVQLNLSNILGQNIDKQILNSNYEKITHTYDLSSFPKGLYFLEIKSNQNRQVIKIIFE
jgi:PKD repeat protein